MNPVFNLIVEFVEPSIELLPFCLRLLEVCAINRTAISKPTAKNRLEVTSLSFEALELLIPNLLLLKIVWLSNIESHYLQWLQLLVRVDIITVVVEDGLKHVLVNVSRQAFYHDCEVRCANCNAVSPYLQLSLPVVHHKEPQPPQHYHDCSQPTLGLIEGATAQRFWMKRYSHNSTV